MTSRAHSIENGTFNDEGAFSAAIAWYLGILNADTATKTQEGLDLLSVPALVTKIEAHQEIDEPQIIR